jgi:hypothetical protein
MNNKISLKDLWQLLLIISFPIQVWSIIQIFNNFEWIANRTYFSDALGYGAYALTFALLDSSITTLPICLIYLPLIYSQGKNKARTIIMSVYFIITGWFIYYKSNMTESQDREFVWNFIREFGDKYNLRLRYETGLFFLFALFIAFTIILPVILIIKFEKAEKFVQNLFERIELLAYVFIFFDLIGVLTVIIRNLKVS